VDPLPTIDPATSRMDSCIHRCFCLVTKVHVKRCRKVFILVSVPTSPAFFVSCFFVTEFSFTEV
jgi:hypothetical protein